MKKADYKKELKHLYQPSATVPTLVDVPSANYVMIDGTGDPNHSVAYAAAVESLFALSYAIKFMAKKGQLAVDYGVMPLEGLWWADDMSAFTSPDRSAWKWTMMILQPPFVTDTMVREAIDELRRKKHLAALDMVRFEVLAEGTCAQIMHIGPFASEGSTIARLHQFIDAMRGTRRGKHHEIYLSDIRKTDPAKWKTVIRQPMARK